MELTREVLEAVRLDRCTMPHCRGCIFHGAKGHPDARSVSVFGDVWCTHPGLVAIAAFSLRQMDRIEELEEERDKYRKALERLSCLGNGGRYGNSDGNMIARAALEGK